MLIVCLPYILGKNPDFVDRLPRPEEFSKALYVFDSGQNDLSYGMITSTEEKTKASIPNMISQFSAAIEVLLMLPKLHL